MKMRYSRFTPLMLSLALMGVAACAPATPSAGPMPGTSAQPPSPDPRIGLSAGMFDAGEAIWNMRILSKTPPTEAFLGETNSDLAFTGPYAIQGSYNGFQVWDISNPSQPSLTTAYVCPASQSDVSVYRNLLFVSGEGLGGRLDCGTQGVTQTTSPDRLRGIRIFDITDIRNPRYISNVQTCRGSHTHTVLKHPSDDQNVYIYVSGSAPVRPADELPGCIAAAPDADPNSALFRIEVIRVPLANPAQAAIVSSPRIFEGLAAPPTHGLSPADRAEIAAAEARGAFIIEVQGQTMVLPSGQADQLLAQVVAARGGTGAPTAADSARLRAALPGMVAQAGGDEGERGPDQCHDITVYPEIGRAGGACEGYGLLLDITDPVNPRRIDAVADSNFAYWHSATFNNAGTKVLFTDEWGGGGQPKCRADDPYEWGANAIFDINNGNLDFRSYYKLPVAQTELENCVAHNGSLIPIPGRDIMVQSWYQGGISVFDWTDSSNPYEIAFFDRGPSDPDEMGPGGTWSVYWYNGAIVSSEIARGLDILELVPSAHISQNEIDAANTVTLDYLNAQGQPRYVWPATFSLARAYLDQLQRGNGLATDRITEIRNDLAAAERVTGAVRSSALESLAGKVNGWVTGAADTAKVRLLVEAIRSLAAAQ